MPSTRRTTPRQDAAYRAFTAAARELVEAMGELTEMEVQYYFDERADMRPQDEPDYDLAAYAYDQRTTPQDEGDHDA